MSLISLNYNERPPLTNAFYAVNPPITALRSQQLRAKQQFQIEQQRRPLIQRPRTAKWCCCYRCCWSRCQAQGTIESSALLSQAISGGVYRWLLKSRLARLWCRLCRIRDLLVLTSTVTRRSDRCFGARRSRRAWSGVTILVESFRGHGHAYLLASLVGEFESFLLV